MNVGWGVVNLALAGTTYPPTTSRTELVRAQLRTENLYFFNIGLDLAYLADSSCGAVFD
jgi:hypothetical protein